MNLAFVHLYTNRDIYGGIFSSLKNTSIQIDLIMIKFKLKLNLILTKKKLATITSFYGHYHFYS